MLKSIKLAAPRRVYPGEILPLARGMKLFDLETWPYIETITLELNMSFMNGLLNTTASSLPSLFMSHRSFKIMVDRDQINIELTICPRRDAIPPPDVNPVPEGHMVYSPSRAFSVLIT